jgi:hypothetical protein
VLGIRQHKKRWVEKYLFRFGRRHFMLPALFPSGFCGVRARTPENNSIQRSGYAIGATGEATHNYFNSPQIFRNGSWVERRWAPNTDRARPTKSTAFSDIRYYSRPI